MALVFQVYYPADFATNNRNKCGGGTEGDGGGVWGQTERQGIITGAEGYAGSEVNQ